MNEIKKRWVKQRVQKQLNAYAAERNLPPISADRWREVIQLALDKGVAEGWLQIDGFDKDGSAIYRQASIEGPP